MYYPCSESKGSDSFAVIRWLIYPTGNRTAFGTSAVTRFSQLTVTNPELLMQFTLDASVVLDKEKIDKDSFGGLLELQTREIIHKIHHKRLLDEKNSSILREMRWLHVQQYVKN